MPDASGFTAADLLAIRQAMARGTRSVAYETRSVTYSSMEELLALERRITLALSGGKARSKQSLGVAVKGF